MCRKLMNGKMIVALAVFLALFIAAGLAGEERTDASGQWKYVLEDGGAKITAYTGRATGALEIPASLDTYPVIGIGEKVFFGKTSLAKVTIPDSVTAIGDHAFNSCTRLTAALIPEGVLSIGKSAFSNCARLQNISIPNSCGSIGESAFNGCSGLTSVIIPEGVTRIENESFRKCTKLESVTIPDSCTSIGDNAFYGCSSLASIFIPDSVVRIGGFAFYNCTKRAVASIPEGAEIGFGAFFDWELTIRERADAEQTMPPVNLALTDTIIESNPTVKSDEDILFPDFIDPDDLREGDDDNDDFDDADWWFVGDDDDEDVIEVYPGMYDDGWEAFDATLTQRMATRTGPDTKYTEDHGTLPQSTEIVVYAQEETGGTTWALVEFVRNNKLVRAYTGMKRIDADTSSIPKTTKKPKTAIVTKETTAYYGPGTAYMALENPVVKGVEVLVYGVDRDFALIEYAIAPDIWMRSWVPVSCVDLE